MINKNYLHETCRNVKRNNSSLPRGRANHSFESYEKYKYLEVTLDKKSHDNVCQGERGKYARSFYAKGNKSGKKTAGSKQISKSPGLRTII